MEVLASMLEAVEGIVDIAAPALLPPEQLAACTERLRAVLAASGERRAERQARRQAEDFDAEEAEALAVRPPTSLEDSQSRGCFAFRRNALGVPYCTSISLHRRPTLHLYQIQELEKVYLNASLHEEGVQACNGRKIYTYVRVYIYVCVYVNIYIYIYILSPSWRAQEENEGEEDLLDQLASVLTAVLRKYGDAALPFLAELMPALGALLEPGRDPEERRIAICILDDILEHCPAGALFHSWVIWYRASSAVHLAGLGLERTTPWCTAWPGHPGRLCASHALPSAHSQVRHMCFLNRATIQVEQALLCLRAMVSHARARRLGAVCGPGGAGAAGGLPRRQRQRAPVQRVRPGRAG